MNKYFTTLLLGATTLGLADAAPRTAQQALAIAKQYAASNGTTIKAQKPIDNRRGAGLRQDYNSPYYVFDKYEGGYVIISGEDQMPAIVGYTDNGSFDADQLPDGLEYFLDQYTATVGYFGSIYGDMGVDEGMEYPRVSPLLGEINWNQNAPYNNLCPLDTIVDSITGEERLTQSYTGCEATAAAQIMYYYKYPSHQPDIESYVTTRKKFSMPAIMADNSPEGAYDWDNMLPSYDNGDESEASKNAVAKLMLHVGCAQHMDYSAVGSGAEGEEAYASFHTMGYDESLLQTVYRRDFSRRHWLEIINNELRHNRPIEYMGYSGSGGHAFVLDGCDGAGFYHINWGWGGKDNGYFDICVLNPHDNSGIGASSSTSGYHSGNIMLIGITPKNLLGEQKQEKDFPELPDYANITWQLTDANGGNTFYYSDIYKYYNPMVATIANNTDREVNDYFYMNSIDENTKEVNDDYTNCVGYDLNPYETGVYNFDFILPAQPTFYNFSVFDGQGLAMGSYEPNYVKVEDPSIYVHFECNASDQYISPDENNGYRFGGYVVNDTVFEVKLTITNTGGHYRGSDLAIGLIKSLTTGTVLELPSNEVVEITKRFNIQPGVEEIFLVVNSNQNIIAEGDFNMFKSFIISIPVISNPTLTGITLNNTESVVTTVGKRLVDGHIVIEKNGQSLDLMGRSFSVAK